MTSKKKGLIIFFCVITVWILILDSHGWYSSDIECVNDRVNSSETVEEVLFRYETGGKELLLYNSIEGEFSQCKLRRRKLAGKSYYKFLSYNNMLPITWEKEWKRLNSNAKYIFVDYEHSIEDIDCNGLTPVGEKIHYTISTGEEKFCWVYVIDKSRKDETPTEGITLGQQKQDKSVVT